MILITCGAVAGRRFASGAPQHRVLAEDGGEREGGETDDRRESESHGGLGGLRYLGTSFIWLVPPLWTVNICTNIFPLHIYKAGARQQELEVL